MRTGTYFSLLTGWLLGLVVCCYLGFDLKLELGLAFGGTSMLTACWLLTK